MKTKRTKALQTRRNKWMRHRAPKRKRLAERPDPTLRLMQAGRGAPISGLAPLYDRNSERGLGQFFEFNRPV